MGAGNDAQFIAIRVALPAARQAGAKVSGTRKAQRLTVADSPQALESLQRRLKFVESARYRVDSILSRLGLRRHPLLRDLPLFGASIAFDLVESVRNLRG